MNLFSNIRNNQFLIDSSWTILGSAIGKGLTFISMLLLAKSLESSLFGKYSFFKSTIETVSFLSLFGFHITITAHISKYKEGENIKLIISSSTFFIVLTCFLFSIIYTFIIKNNFEFVSENYILIYILFFFGSLSISLNYLYNGILSGLGYFKQNSFINLITGILIFSILPLIGEYYSLKVVLVVAVFLFSSTTIMFIHTLKKKSFLTLPKYNKKFYSFLKLSFPIGLQEICFPIYSWSLNFFILSYLGSNYLGIYSTVISFYIMILFVPGILRNVLLRHLSINNTIEKNDSINKIFTQSILINIFSIFFPLVFLIFFHEYLINFLGQSFLNISLLIYPISLMAIIAAVSNPYYQYYISESKNWKLFFIRFIKDLTTLFLIFLILYFELFSKEDALKYIIFISSSTAFLLLLYMFIDRLKYKNKK